MRGHFMPNLRLILYHLVCLYNHTMAQQKYDLTGLEDRFTKLKSDPRSAEIKALQFILSLNSAVSFDEILVREGFDAYPEQQSLESKESLDPFMEFFRYMEDNLESIESGYLQDSADQEQIEQAKKEQDQTNYNFLLNKNSVSKFIRDQAAHYQQVLEKYLQGAEDEQKGVSTPQMHRFLIDLFKHSCAAVIIDGKPYLQRSTADIQVDLGGSLTRYATQQKDMDAEQASQQFSIPEDQMLDFLTFWLQEHPTLYVLYARTHQRIRRQTAFLTQNSSSTPVHPSAMTKEEIAEVEEQQRQKMEESGLQESSLKRTHHKVKDASGLNLMGLSGVSQTGEAMEGEQREKAPQLSQEERLKAQLKGLFEFGCKRKYRLSKNTTFGDIADQAHSMDLDKFMSFCKFFELNSLISRELLVEYFKLFATNQRTLDRKSFEKVVMRMFNAQPRVAENLLSKIKFDHRLKSKQIRQYKKTNNNPSKYKFALHPINGKDVSTIQKQLSFRKLQKMIVKEEKDVKALAKREQKEKIERNERSQGIRTQRGVGRNYSTKGAKLSTLDLESIRDNKFNPQSLVSNNSDSDRLWDAYEAKIWKKQDRSGSVLESILSKRMQKGHSVLTKINSELSFLHN